MRRLLGAAAARPSELPSLSPFFISRVQALARQRAADATRFAFAASAWRAVPVCLTLVAAMTVWALVESGRARSDRQQALRAAVWEGETTGAEAAWLALLVTATTGQAGGAP